MNRSGRVCLLGMFLLVMAVCCPQFVSGQSPAPANKETNEESNEKQDNVVTEEATETDAESPSLGTDADWEALQKSVTLYAEAFNAGDAASVAELYAPNAEWVDAKGTTFQGRKNIEAEYAAFFKAHPKAELRLVVESLKFLTPSVAVEDGRAFLSLAERGQDEDQDEAATTTKVVVSNYTAVHSKESGRWQLVSVRDQQPKVDEQSNLEQLSWMIGRWVDEDPESLLEIDCYWHESGAYLIRDFKVKVEGLIAAEGTERIGWDPVRKEIRSWLFDTSGGFMDARWTKTEKGWNIDARGFRADGQPTHATYVVTPLRKDAYYLASSNRTAGTETLDDLEMTIVRIPPPAETPKVDVPEEPAEKRDQKGPQDSKSE